MPQVALLARRLLLAGVVLVCVGVVLATEEAALTELVRRLGSSSFAERAEASRALERRGASALPALREAARSPDAEVRRRATAILAAVEERQLREALLAPRPYRFQFQDKPLRHALYEIETATGLHLRGPASPAWGRRTVTLDTGALPFWQAWARFCREAGLREADRADLPEPLTALRLTEEVVTGRPVDASTPLRVRVLAVGGMQRHEPPQLPRPNAGVLELWADPRLDLWDVPAVRLTEASGPDGKPVPLNGAPVAGPPGMSLLDARTGRVAVPRRGLLVPLSVPGVKQGDTLRELRGTVTARFLVRRPCVEVGDVLRAGGKSFHGPNGLAVQVLHAQRIDEGDVAVRLRLENHVGLTEAGLAEAVKLRRNVVVKRGPDVVPLPLIELHDRQGRIWLTDEAASLEVADRKEEYRVRFQGRAGTTDGLRLVILSQRLVTVEIPFVLKDVPIGERP